MNDNIERDLENVVKLLADRHLENRLKKLDERDLESRVKKILDDERAVRDLEKSLVKLIAKQYEVYKKTSNPLYIWQAYSLYREVDLPIPDWIHEYLDQCSKNLMNHWDNPPNEPAKAIAKSLNMASPGRGSVFTETSRRDLNIAMLMELYLLMDTKQKKDQLYDYFAKRFDVSRSTVQRAWTEWGGEKKE
ncbi:MAG: hypothetical protein KME63_07255 [Candidatus Thiodiazotropha sp. (ex Clathrolucina costata)]|nr:hypothetical protein [Candidatus Thiodiazotropha taylori]